MNEITWLRSHVERCLQDAWEKYPINADADGDYDFRYGTAQCYVSIQYGDPSFVRVWGLAAQIPKRSPKLLHELNELNQRAPSAHVYYESGWVVAEQVIHADGVAPETLEQACLAVGQMAGGMGVLIAAMFGGETHYPVAEVEAEESR